MSTKLRCSTFIKSLGLIVVVATSAFAGYVMACRAHNISSDNYLVSVAPEFIAGSQGISEEDRTINSLIISISFAATVTASALQHQNDSELQQKLIAIESSQKDSISQLQKYTQLRATAPR